MGVLDCSDSCYFSEDSKLSISIAMQFYDKKKLKSFFLIFVIFRFMKSLIKVLDLFCGKVNLLLNLR